MTFRWWTRLALVSAIAGFVVSGPPSDFESPDFQSPITLSNDSPMQSHAPSTIATTELVTTELDTPKVDSDPAEDAEFIAPLAEGDQTAAAAP